MRRPRLRTVSALAASLVAAALALSLAPARRAPAAAPAPAGVSAAKATFAGGCFWCMEPPFDELPGVVSTTSGYTGGPKPRPTYEEVSSGGTGHLEVVQVAFDPKKVSYETLLDVFWRNVDPFDPGGQFCDKGEQYRTAVFAHDDAQRKAAEASKKALEKRLGRAVATQVFAATDFWPAEAYHQDYYVKNPLRYKLYRRGCGRDARLDAVWGKDRKTSAVRARE